MRQAKNILAEGQVPSGGKRAPLIFLLAVIAFIGYALIDTATIPSYAFVDAVFPVTIASITLVCALVLLVQMQLQPETHSLFADREKSTDPDEVSRYGLWPTLSWFAGLLLATSLLGFILALGLFLLAFFRVRAGLDWLRVIGFTAAGIAFMCFMAWLLNRDFPPGLLQHYTNLPWPLV